MGSGKSYIGKRFASRLGLDFLDMDAYLEEKQGMSVAEIFEKEGEHFFRQLEYKYLRQLEAMERTVIATGGGTPCFNENMEWMNRHGITIYLDVPVDTLHKRLISELEKRPLLKGKTPLELKTFLRSKLEERMGFYSQAQFVCHADYPVGEIMESLGKYFFRFFPMLNGEKE